MSLNVDKKEFNRKLFYGFMDTLELHEIFSVMESAERQELSYDKADYRARDPVKMACANDKDRQAMQKLALEYRERSWFFRNMRLGCENYLIKMFLEPRGQDDARPQGQGLARDFLERAQSARTRDQESSIEIAKEMGGAS